MDDRLYKIAIAELQGRVRELETALTRTRGIADAERRRAERAEEATQRAYRLSTWPARRSGQETR